MMASAKPLGSTKSGLKAKKNCKEKEKIKNLRDDSIVGKKKSYLQVYNKKWEEALSLTGWIQPSRRGVYFAYCSICDRDVNIGSGKTTLLRHGESARHLKNNAYSQSIMTDRSSFTMKSEDNERHSNSSSATPLQRIGNTNSFFVLGLIDVMDLQSKKIGFIGCGNIAKAIGGGLIKAGTVPASNVMVSAPSVRSFSSWEDLGARTTHDNSELCEWASIIFLCMKPYQFEAAAQSIVRTDTSSRKLFVSTLSGTPAKTLKTKLSHLEPFCVIRSMPNTPLLVGAGCTVLAESSDATDDEMKLIKSIYESMGKCEIIAERLISPVIGVAGSSPAFVYVIIEAMADAGVKGGLTRQHAETFAAQAVMGAAKMVLESGQHPGQLKDAVCSPAGTTIYGIEALERSGLRAAVMAAVDASTQRSEEMAKIFE